MWWHVPGPTDVKKKPIVLKYILYTVVVKNVFNNLVQVPATRVRGTLNPVLRVAVRLEDGHPSGERLLTARHVVGRVVRDQGPGPVPDGRRGRHRGPVVRPAPQDFRIYQLVQLVPDVGVHPAVDDRVRHRRRHGGQVAKGQWQVQLFGGYLRGHQVGGQRKQGQREPADGEHDRYPCNKNHNARYCNQQGRDLQYFPFKCVLRECFKNTIAYCNLQ